MILTSLSIVDCLEIFNELVTENNIDSPTYGACDHHWRMWPWFHASPMQRILFIPKVGCNCLSAIKIVLKTTVSNAKVRTKLADMLDKELYQIIHNRRFVSRNRSNTHRLRCHEFLSQPLALVIRVNLKGQGKLLPVIICEQSKIWWKGFCCFDGSPLTS